MVHILSNARSVSPMSTFNTKSLLFYQSPFVHRWENCVFTGIKICLNSLNISWRTGRKHSSFSVISFHCSVSFLPVTASLLSFVCCPLPAALCTVTSNQVYFPPPHICLTKKKKNFSNGINKIVLCWEEIKQGLFFYLHLGFIRSLYCTNSTLPHVN